MELEPALITECDLIPADMFSFGELSAETVREQTAKAASIRVATRIKTRRAKSEAEIANLLPNRITPGESWHVISQGDIDSLSYLGHIATHEPLDYVLLSTWCMAGEDVKRLRQWIDSERIGRLDCYVGEIFPSQYADAYSMLCAAARSSGGRVCVFRNHAKVYVAKNARVSLAIESSANVNTNPRCEQTAIHASAELAEFYKTFFDGIRSFTRDFDDWTPYGTPRPTA